MLAIFLSGLGNWSGHKHVEPVQPLGPWKDSRGDGGI